MDLLHQARKMKKVGPKANFSVPYMYLMVKSSGFKDIPGGIHLRPGAFFMLFPKK